MDFSFGRDLAIIWLSLFCLMALLIPIVALYFVVRFMNTVQQKTKAVIQQGQVQVKAVREKTDQASQMAIEPVMRLRSNLTRAKTTLSRIKNPNKSY